MTKNSDSNGQMNRQTNTINANSQQIFGFEMVVAEYSRSHGIATYIKQGHSDVSIVDTIYLSTIRTGSISVTNVYKSPQVQWIDPVLAIQPHPAIYAADFTSHHTEWGYCRDDENGDALVSWASLGELKLVHDAKDRRTSYSKAHKTESTGLMLRQRR